MQNEVLEILNSIEPHLWWLLAKVVIAGGVVIFLKGILENIANYFLFMGNKRLGINVRVEVRGHTGTIKEYNKRWIFILTDDGDEIIIPIRRWQYEQWKLLDPNKCRE